MEEKTGCNTPSSSRKRCRSSNWSESEKTLLTELIKGKIHLIENKDVSKNNNKLKKAAWQSILQSFNELNHPPRDLSQLLNQWRNTKNNIKKRNFQYRRESLATGGGPPPRSPPPEDMEIMQLLPCEFEIDHNVFDSDSLNINEDTDAKKDNGADLTSLSSAIPPTPKISRSDSGEDKDIGKSVTKSSVLIKKTKKKVTTTPESKVLFELAKSGRQKLIAYQEEEHRLKVEIMQKEHKLRMEVLKRELEYWETKKSNL